MGRPGYWSGGGRARCLCSSPRQKAIDLVVVRGGAVIAIKADALAAMIRFHFRFCNSARHLVGWAAIYMGIRAEPSLSLESHATRTPVPSLLLARTAGVTVGGLRRSV